MTKNVKLLNNSYSHGEKDYIINLVVSDECDWLDCQCWEMIHSNEKKKNRFARRSNNAMPYCKFV